MTKFNTQFEITNAIIDLSPKAMGIKGTEKMVLISLSRFFGLDDQGNWSCYPSRSDIALRSGCKEEDVTKRINKMVDLGILSKHDTKSGNNVYTLISLPDSDTKAEVAQRKNKLYQSTKSLKSQTIVNEPQQAPVTMIPDFGLDDEIECLLQPYDEGEEQPTMDDYSKVEAMTFSMTEILDQQPEVIPEIQALPEGYDPFGEHDTVEDYEKSKSHDFKSWCAANPWDNPNATHAQDELARKQKRERVEQWKENGGAYGHVQHTWDDFGGKQSGFYQSPF